MSKALVALVGFGVNAVAFWAMIIIIVLAVGNQILAWVGAAVALGLGVGLYFMAIGQNGDRS